MGRRKETGKNRDGGGSALHCRCYSSTEGCGSLFRCLTGQLISCCSRAAVNITTKLLMVMEVIEKEVNTKSEP